MAGDIYAKITNEIVAAIENGADSFEMPWHRDGGAMHRPKNAKTGNSYSGVNVIALWVAAQRKGYGSGLWSTYRQWDSLGAHVRRGEKGAPAVFYKNLESEVSDDEGGTTEYRKYAVARTSWVFNADQVDGYELPKAPLSNLVDAIDSAEAFVGATGAEIHHGGDRAYYDSLEDRIRIPDRERFTGTRTSSATESYYAVLLHELTHYAASRIMPRRLSSLSDHGGSSRFLAA